MFSIKILTKETFFPLFEKFRPIVFEDTHSFTWRDVLPPKELDQIEKLNENMGKRFELHLGVFNEIDEFIGWCSGYQNSKDSFCMMNSGVLKEYQRQGIYSALLQKNLEILTEKGFQIIWSRHCATNNAVIIPKLRAGFIISSLEIDDCFGTLIQLRYYTNASRRKIMDYRCGQRKPDKELKEIFKIQ